jgi:CheY-like chemotaxis protein/two-component sensor histidine kinase
VDYARTILSSGRDLLSLINQILDLSKIESGKMETERRRVPLGEVRAYAEQHFGPIAKQKNLTFTTAINPDAPPTISTDAQRFQQILKNLLSNAFKFTETGSIDLRISVEPDTHKFQSQTLRRAPAALAFAVTDTGIGIAPDKQQLIFEAFQQADASTSRVYGGTGLGLTISRELARLLGGEIHLQSAVGAGSTFTLYLPMAHEDRSPMLPSDTVRGREALGYEDTHTVQAAPVSQAIAPEGPASPPVSADLSGATILAVDDDVRNLFAISSMLERQGAKVLPAGSAREAFDVLEKSSDVSAVLMDMMMPEVDGYQATRRLRENPRYRELPIIALTAKAMPGDREKAIEVGCTDFVAKPVERERLTAVLRHWMKKRP